MVGRARARSGLVAAACDHAGAAAAPAHPVPREGSAPPATRHGRRAAGARRASPMTARPTRRQPPPPRVRCAGGKPPPWSCGAGLIAAAGWIAWPGDPAPPATRGQPVRADVSRRRPDGRVIGGVDVGQVAISPDGCPHRLPDAARAGRPGARPARRDVHRSARRERQLAVLLARWPLDRLHDVVVHAAQGARERRPVGRSVDGHGQRRDRRVGHRAASSSPINGGCSACPSDGGRAVAVPLRLGPNEQATFPEGPAGRTRGALHRHRHAVEYAGRRRGRSRRPASTPWIS